MVRQWCQSTLAPKIPALEAGTEQPFELMKKMAKTFGFDAMLGGAVQEADREAARRRATDADVDAERRVGERRAATR